MSSRFRFGFRGPGQAAERIDAALREAYPGTLSRTDIRDLFSRGATQECIAAALEELASEGRAEFFMLETKGRPAQCWRSVPNK